jgi:hypothetical protein
MIMRALLPKHGRNKHKQGALYSIRGTHDTHSPYYPTSGDSFIEETQNAPRTRFGGLMTRTPRTGQLQGVELLTQTHQGHDTHKAMQLARHEPARQQKRKSLSSPNMDFKAGSVVAGPCPQHMHLVAPAPTAL